MSVCLAPFKFPAVPHADCACEVPCVCARRARVTSEHTLSLGVCLQVCGHRGLGYLELAPAASTLGPAMPGTTLSTVEAWLEDMGVQDAHYVPFRCLAASVISQHNPPPGRHALRTCLRPLQHVPRAARRTRRLRVEADTRQWPNQHSIHHNSQQRDELLYFGDFGIKVRFCVPAWWRALCCKVVAGTHAHGSRPTREHIRVFQYASCCS